MRLLVLGGTRFLGRHIVEAALRGDHQVTLFNRGRTGPNLFPEAERLAGDRRKDLDSLRGREWDAVIDTCGYVPSEARSSAELLADRVGAYIFVSSISVYKDFPRPGMDESAGTEDRPDGPPPEDDKPETYGIRKLLCEEAVEAALPGRACLVRPGLIVGPHDPSGRFPYWVGRVAEGGDVLAPGAPERPVQFIDAADLAEWLLRAAQERTAGLYNAVCPPLPFGELLAACRKASDSDARFEWIEDRFLLDNEVGPWMELPLWLPADKAGMLQVSAERARKAGLRCRPVGETVSAVLDWIRKLDGPPPGGCGLDRSKERDLLRRWQERA